jgi:hypothetical protein
MVIALKLDLPIARVWVHKLKVAEWQHGQIQGHRCIDIRRAYVIENILPFMPPVVPTHVHVSPAINKVVEHEALITRSYLGRKSDRAPVTIKGDFDEWSSGDYRAHDIRRI